MALKSGIFLIRNIFVFRVFTVRQNNCCEPFSFHKGFFNKNPEKVEFKTKPCRPCINFYIKSFSGSTNAVAIRSVKWMVRCYTAPRYVHLIGNKSLWKKSVSLILHILWITLRKISECFYLQLSFLSIDSSVTSASVRAVYMFLRASKQKRCPHFPHLLLFLLKLPSQGILNYCGQRIYQKAFLNWLCQY